MSQWTKSRLSNSFWEYVGVGVGCGISHILKLLVQWGETDECTF